MKWGLYWDSFVEILDFVMVMMSGYIKFLKNRGFWDMRDSLSLLVELSREAEGVIMNHWMKLLLKINNYCGAFGNDETIF